MNYKAGATHKLKPSPVGPDIPKLEQPQNPVFNKIMKRKRNNTRTNVSKNKEKLRKMFLGCFEHLTMDLKERLNLEIY